MLTRSTLEKQILIDEVSRKLLLKEIGKAIHDAAQKLARNIEGDYAPDPAANRYPAFIGTAPSVAPQPKSAKVTETISKLFARWSAHHLDKKAASTIRRYGPSIASLDKWAKDRDWRSLTDQDIFDWAKYRNEEEGVSPATVNRNDLVAVSSMLAWATGLSGGCAGACASRRAW